jgi:hypothetical protein
MRCTAEMNLLKSLQKWVAAENPSANGDLSE